MQWKAKEEASKRIEDFPKKKWYWYEPARIVATVVITAILAVPIAYLKGVNDGKEQAPAGSKAALPIMPVDASKRQIAPQMAKKLPLKSFQV
ncbi:hypothetical protein [Paraflavitalea speifideaquila]|uniref:hypothetical protein n=1 Tax=Paraflavitalea speifideaquila TaxID=3076558 RepID=UPI0028E74779|nr:hypothetical protein [Paraflavitalea speifideiaquila]